MVIYRLMYLWHLTLLSRSPYCIAILIGLFLTTCSWSSMPPSAFETTSLSALNVTELNATWQMTSIAMVSRCWCDFQRTPFFDYYNVTEWEINSIKQSIEVSSTLELLSEADVSVDQESPIDQRSAHGAHSRVWKWVSGLKEGLGKNLSGGHFKHSDDQKEMPEITGPVQVPQNERPPTRQETLPWLRWKYDLRPHGIDLIVDLGWRRSE